MQYIEYQVMNTRLMNMGNGDIAEQTKLRSEYLDRLRLEQDERLKSGQPLMSTWNPFPEWVQELIEQVSREQYKKARGGWPTRFWRWVTKQSKACELQCMAHFDDENRVYRMAVPGQRKDFEAFYADWAARFEEARKKRPDGEQWSTENVVRVISSYENENDALLELDIHHSGQPSTQVGDRSPKEAMVKAEQTARAQV